MLPLSGGAPESVIGITRRRSWGYHRRVNRFRVLVVVLGLVAAPLVVLAAVRAESHRAPVGAAPAAARHRAARRFFAEWEREHPGFGCTLNAGGTVATCISAGGDTSSSSNELVLVVDGSDVR
jgi:hypothetical protein